MIPHELLKKDNGDECRLLLTPGQRLLLLLCVMIFCWVACSVVNGILIGRLGQTVRVLRIAAVLQSVFQIILPALVTAMLVSRRPARLLEIDRSPRIVPVAWGIMLLFVSMPALNCVIQWNASLQLPESAAEIMQWMKNAEDSAAKTIEIMQGGGSIGDLIMNILIIGIMAGLGEELLFRGTLQRILQTSGMNPHLCIWLVAALFSAIHMQFFGFVPRMLLGALFGYLLYWSGCLWLPVLVHASNNIIYVTAQWIALRGHGDTPAVDRVGTMPGEYVYVVVSVFLSVLLLWRIRTDCRD